MAHTVRCMLTGNNLLFRKNYSCLVIWVDIYGFWGGGGFACTCQAVSGPFFWVLRSTASSGPSPWLTGLVGGLGGKQGHRLRKRSESNPGLNTAMMQRGSDGSTLLPHCYISCLSVSRLCFLLYDRRGKAITLSLILLIQNWQSQWEILFSPRKLDPTYSPASRPDCTHLRRMKSKIPKESCCLCWLVKSLLKHDFNHREEAREQAAETDQRANLF